MKSRTPLSQLASVIISSVDKKTEPNEQLVRLCNFTDVYKNWQITSFCSKDFMKATANRKEIDSFSIKKGQVAITKDSETRDDIGVSTYIADDVDAVLGYHCALITPSNNLSGSFLNALFHTKYANRYFEANSSGSGQRFTITDKSIGRFKIPDFDMCDQVKIGDFCTDVEKKIETNKKIYFESEKLINNLYSYWFEQYDFPNQYGKPYSKDNGQLVGVEHFKHKIPNGWNIKRINSILIEKEKSKIQVNQAQKQRGSIPFFTSGDSLLRIDTGAVDGFNIFMSTGGNAVIKAHFGKANYSTDTWCINAGIYSAYLYLFLKSISQRINDYFFAGSGLKHLQKDQLKSIFIPIPPKELIERFNKIVLPLFEIESKTINENYELNEIRDYILPLLISEQARIN